MLARLEAFLPELKRANEMLDPTRANIENEENSDDDDADADEDGGICMQGHKDRRHDDQPHIEMVRTEVYPRRFPGPRLGGVSDIPFSFFFLFASALPFFSL